MQPRTLFKLLVIAGVIQLVGDLALFMSARSLSAPVAWLAPTMSRPVPDSLRQKVSRYLRDTLGIHSQRQGDTLLLSVSPEARRAIDDQVYVAQQAGRSAAPWLIAAMILLHAPILIAIGATIATIRSSAQAERNRAMREWTEDT